MAEALVRIQYQDFDPAAELAALEAEPGAGAVVSFMGLVRDMNEAEVVEGITLEHYPGMTEAACRRAVAEAERRWPLAGTRLIHRVGHLSVNDRIVFVAAASAHRKAAFAACDFLMDYLKTQVPIWKKEHRSSGSLWLEQKGVDRAHAEQWGSGGAAGGPG